MSVQFIPRNNTFNFDVPNFGVPLVPVPGGISFTEDFIDIVKTDCSANIPPCKQSLLSPLTKLFAEVGKKVQQV